METVYTKNQDFVQREVAGECILVPVRRRLADANCLYVLNETGAAVWRRIDGTKSVQDITLELLEEFDVARPQLDADVASLIEDLLSIHAIHAVGQAP
jgi:hypothetical protein